MAIDPGLRRLALGTLLAAFPGESAPGWALDLLGQGLAGYTLFATNVAGAGQLAVLIAELRAARPDVLVAIDEEGGDVTRLEHRTGSRYPGNAALGVVDDPFLTRTVYAALGTDLAHAGINLDLAPTVDVNSADDNPVIGTRSFGGTTALVARHAAAAVEGLQSTGVAACAKHFPGHGATLADSHLELPTVDASPELLRERDLPPFAAAISAGVRAVMSAHIRVPALTGDGPATFSRRALTDLLRGEYGFRGVIVTDALEMKAAVPEGGIGPAAVRALAAGADLLCLGARVDLPLVESVLAEIVRAVGDARLAPARIEDAVERTAGLAAWTATPRTLPGPDARLGVAAARRAVRIEGSLAGVAHPLVVQLVGGRSIVAGRVPWGLEPHLSGVELVELEEATASADAIATRAAARPIVIVGRHIRAGRGVVDQLAARHPVVVLEMGWPSSWRPAHARAFVTTYGASLANGRAAAEALRLLRHTS